MHALLIAASPSKISRSATLLDAAEIALEHEVIGVRRLSLRELPADALLRADSTELSIESALDAVARADALVFATPIYKAAYSGLLKVFLDLLPQDGLRGKWVWPLATGGSPAHTLALDHSLRPVLDSLGAHQVLQSVYALESQIAWPVDSLAAQLDAAIQDRLRIGATRLSEAFDQRMHRMRSDRSARGLAGSVLTSSDAARCSA
jgi:FMN reductase